MLLMLTLVHMLSPETLEPTNHQAIYNTHNAKRAVTSTLICCSCTCTLAMHNTSIVFCVGAAEVPLVLCSSCSTVHVHCTLHGLLAVVLLHCKDCVKVLGYS